MSRVVRHSVSIQSRIPVIFVERSLQRQMGRIAYPNVEAGRVDQIASIIENMLHGKKTQERVLREGDLSD